MAMFIIVGRSKKRTGIEIGGGKEVIQVGDGEMKIMAKVDVRGNDELGIWIMNSDRLERTERDL